MEDQEMNKFLQQFPQDCGLCLRNAHEGNSKGGVVLIVSETEQNWLSRSSPESDAVDSYRRSQGSPVAVCTLVET